MLYRCHDTCITFYLHMRGQSYGSSSQVPGPEEHRVLGQAVFHRRHGRYGPGPVLHPAGRHHSQHPGPAAAHRIPDGGHRHPGQGRGRRDLHHRRPVLGHGGPGHGGGHRPGAGGPSPGAVFPDSRGLRH